MRASKIGNNISTIEPKWSTINLRFLASEIAMGEGDGVSPAFHTISGAGGQHN